MTISPHISYAEATKSAEAIRFAIPNEPTALQLESMRHVANTCFEPLRAWYGKPIYVSSFFRSTKLNESVGGSTKSQHCRGEAIDIDADFFDNGITNKQIFDWLLKNVPFDQLIWEFGTANNPAWVHISCKKTGNRGQVLRAYKEGDETKYKKFI